MNISQASFWPESASLSVIILSEQVLPGRPGKQHTQLSSSWLCVKFPLQPGLSRTTQPTGAKGPFPQAGVAWSQGNREKALLTDRKQALPVPSSPSEWCHSELSRHLTLSVQGKPSKNKLAIMKTDK